MALVTVTALMERHVTSGHDLSLAFLFSRPVLFLLLLLFNVLSLFYLYLLHRLKRRVVLIPRSTHLSTHAQINHHHSRFHFGVLNSTSTYTLALRHTKCRQPWVLWPPCFWLGGVGRKVEDEGMDGLTKTENVGWGRGWDVCGEGGEVPRQISR